MNLHDAYRLLDIAPDAPRGQVRAAYARLLPTFRPDRDAEGFQRLRRAYEMALAFAPPDPVLDASPQPEGDDLPAPAASTPTPPPGPTPHEAITEAWKTAAAGHLSHARDLVRRVREQHGDGAEAAVHTFLLDEAGGVPTARALRAALRQVPDRVAALDAFLRVLEPREGRALVRWMRPALGSVLRDRPPGAAARILRAQLHDALLRQDARRAETLVRHPDVLAAAADAPWLAVLAREAMAGLVLCAPERAERIAADFPPDAADSPYDACLDTWATLRRTGARATARGAKLPRALGRWLALYPVLDPRDAHRLARLLREDALHQPEAYRDSLARLGNRDPAFLDWVIGALSESQDRRALPEHNPALQVAATLAARRLHPLIEAAHRRSGWRAWLGYAGRVVMLYCMVAFFLPGLALVAVVLALAGFFPLPRRRKPALAQQWAIDAEIFRTVVSECIPPRELRDAARREGIPYLEERTDPKDDRSVRARVLLAAYWISQVGHGLRPPDAGEA